MNGEARDLAQDASIKARGGIDRDPTTYGCQINLEFAVGKRPAVAPTRQAVPGKVETSDPNPLRAARTYMCHGRTKTQGEDPFAAYAIAEAATAEGFEPMLPPELVALLLLATGRGLGLEKLVDPDAVPEPTIGALLAQFVTPTA